MFEAAGDPMAAISAAAANQAAAASPAAASSAIAIAYATRGEVTVAADRYETGNLRIRFPRNLGHCQAMIVNTGGGIAGGDRLSLGTSISACRCRGGRHQPGGGKALSSEGATATIETRLRLAAGARFAWLPQETILYDGARLDRRISRRARAGRQR